MHFHIQTPVVGQPDLDSSTVQHDARPRVYLELLPFRIPSSRVPNERKHLAAEMNSALAKEYILSRVCGMAAALRHQTAQREVAL